MTLEDVTMIVTFFGGLGMFLYGMKMMSAGLQKFAGDKMQHMMGVLTNNRFMGLLVGGLVTMIIQSSGATSVMAIGRYQFSQILHEDFEVHGVCQ